MFRNTHLFVIAMITLASVACATPPQAQVDRANAALTKATAAGATGMSRRRQTPPKTRRVPSSPPTVNTEPEGSR
jgi:hypothetical protein